jgi:flagellar hook-associated protein 1 FlgK
MSLISGLKVGQSALMASQAALQIIGNNVSNASTPNYARETPLLESVVQASPAGTGTTVGQGVQMVGVQRLTNEAVNAQLRSGASDQYGTQSASDQLSSVQTTFDPLGANSLASQLTAFFNGFSNLANNPQDSGQRGLLLQDGAALARSINSASQALNDQRAQINQQLSSLTTQANQLIGQVATYNGQVIAATAAGNSQAAAGLSDERDAALAQLSQIMDIQTQTNGNGAINVYSNSQSLVAGVESSQLATVVDAMSDTGDLVVTDADTGGVLPISGGQIGGLLSARANGVDAVQSSLNTLASALIEQVNAVHSQGQGLNPIESATSTNRVSDASAALNAAGLFQAPVNGRFTVNVTGRAGQSVATTITVNLSGTGAPTTLNSLAGQLSGVAGVTAMVLPDGRLRIDAASGYSISFANDSSGVLGAMGLNTFFSGHDANDIAVRSDLSGGDIAASRNGLPGDNSNALQLASLAGGKVDSLGGVSLTDYFNNTMGTLAGQISQAKTANASAGTLVNALSSQQAAVSGVSIDQEAIDLMTYQRAYQGAARYISTLKTLTDEMMQMI